MKILFKIVVILLTIVLFGSIGFYTVQSGRVFYKACDFDIRGREHLAIFAHQAVLNNYSFSPFATISRVFLYKNPSDLVELSRNRVSAVTDVKVIGNPVFVDYFVFAGLVVYLLLGVLGGGQKLSGWSGFKFKSLVFRIIYALIVGGGYWIAKQVHTGAESFRGLREVVMNIREDIVAEQSFFIITNIAAGYVLIVLIYAIFKYFLSFKSVPEKIVTTEEELHNEILA